MEAKENLKIPRIMVNKEEQKQHIIDLMNMGDYKTNTMKTALQQLVATLEDFVKELDQKYDGDPWVKRGVLISITEAKKLLETERQQIEDAYRAGWEFKSCTSLVDCNKLPSNYYTIKYKL